MAKRQIEDQKSRKDVTIWLLLLWTLIPASLLLLSAWNDQRRFATNLPLVATTGTVAATDCQNHGRISVRYEIERASLTEEAGSILLNGSCDEVSVGQILSIWVSAKNPHYFSFFPAYESQVRLRDELWTMAIIPFPLFFGFAFLGTRFSKRRIYWAPHFPWFVFGRRSQPRSDCTQE